MARRADVTASSSIGGRGWNADSLAGPEAERALRRSLGPTAWAVLAELQLAVSTEGAGGTTVAASARGLAAQLGITKNSAARALRTLAAAGIVRRRPQPTSPAGHFAAGLYELLLVPPAAPRHPNRDTVQVGVSSAPANTRPRRGHRATIGSDSGQLSLLETTPAATVADGLEAP